MLFFLGVWMATSARLRRFSCVFFSFSFSSSSSYCCCRFVFVSLEASTIVNGRASVSAHDEIEIISFGVFFCGLEKWTNCKKKKSVIMSWVCFIFETMEPKWHIHTHQNGKRTSTRGRTHISSCKRDRENSYNEFNWNRRWLERREEKRREKKNENLFSTFDGRTH